MAMVKGKTSTGFAFKIDPDVVRDMEFIELVAAARNDGLLLPELITRLLGPEQKKQFYDHIRKGNGTVPVDAVADEFAEIVESLNENPETKN